jgi:hypothetical protein
MQREIEIPRPRRNPSMPSRALDPSAGLRAAARRAELRNLLKPARQRADVIETLATMPAFPYPKKADAMNARALTDLAGLPSFAIGAAAADFRLGRAGDRWRPTTRQLALLARAKVRPFQVELARIERALAAAALVGEARQIAALDAAAIADGCALPGA